MSKKTIYIIGAGASYEAGLPTGEELKEKISRLLNFRFEFNKLKSGDYSILEAIRKHTSNDDTFLNKCVKDCQHISENIQFSISIDNFIDSHRDNLDLALCGKLAIIKSILESEKKSIFYDKQTPNRNLDFKFNFGQLSSTWYLALFKTLTENCNYNQLLKRLSTITLIIFNYDRCIEFYLINAFIKFYKLKVHEAKELMDSLTIIHPYGTVGKLPWQGSNNAMHFGGDTTSVDILELAKEINTFTEGADSENYNLIEDNIKNAQRLIFLGFAYHPLNMRLLNNKNEMGHNNKEVVECYGTAFGSSNADIQLIKANIKSIYKIRPKIVEIEDLKCLDIFQHYSRSLGYSS